MLLGAGIPFVVLLGACSSDAPADTTTAATPTTCGYEDAGDGSPISADTGARFTDSLGRIYLVEDDCTLTQVGCSYEDAGDGSTIEADLGSTFTDSLGKAYRVEQDCSLTITTVPTT